MDYIKLRNILETNKLSIAQLCKKIGVHRSTIYYNFENKNMSVETLEKICDAINMPIQEFFNSTDITAAAEPGTNYKVKNLDYKRKLEICEIEKQALQNQLIDLKKILLK